MPKTTRVSFEVLPIENDGFHLFLKGKINRKNAMFIIDTGASRSVFDKIAMESYIRNHTYDKNDQLTIGVGSNQLTSMVTTIKSLRFGSLKIENYTAVVIDLENVRSTYERLQLPVIHGILGCDILEKHQALIDFTKRKIRFTV
jgi:predicted aspartyl protease